MPVDPNALVTWANAITAGRLVLSPVMFLVIPDHQRGAWLAYLLWFALSLSDGIDGWVARRHGTTSTGAFLDPLADKVLVLGAMFTLVSRDMFPLLPVLLIAGRELVISVYRVLVGSKCGAFCAKDCEIQDGCAAVSGGIRAVAWFAADYRWLWMGLLWLAVALALVSGAQYLLASRAARK